MKKKKVNLLAIIVLATIVSCFGQGLEQGVRDWESRAVFNHAFVGVSAFEIESGKKVVGVNNQKLFNPASSQKILTTFIALEKLGDNFTYSTTLGYEGKIGSDGTLEGNLIVIGSGDPSLGSTRFDGFPTFESVIKKIVEEVKKAGITCIDGDIIVNESIYNSYPTCPSWQWNDLGNYYASGAWGINVNENEYNVYYNSNLPIGSVAKLNGIYPKVKNLKLSTEVLVDSAGTGDNAYIFGGAYNYDKRIVGTIPFDKSTFRIKGSIPDPPRFLAQHIYENLEAVKIPSSGIKVIFRKENRPKPTVLYTFVSPTLVEQIKETNFHSINLYCESFLKTLGLKYWSESSSTAGLKVIEKHLTSIGINTTALAMQDGSGLSARNLMSPDVLANFVAKFTRKNGIEVTKSILPKAGAQGTVRGMLAQTSALGNVWMKSGSMDKVMSYTGVIKTRSGKWISFAVIANGLLEKPSMAKKHFNDLINMLYLKA